MPDDHPSKSRGAHIYGGTPVSYAESLEHARQFRKDHPQPPLPTKTVDYLLGPDGKRWPDPPGWG